jgi:GntR family transcriptional regulator
VQNVAVADLGLRPLQPDRPKGDQVRELLEALAVSVGPGGLIPSDRALAEHLGVARQTVRTEVAHLVADGVLVNRPARGTFVAALPPRPQVVGRSFSHDMRARGREPGARVLQRDVLPATDRLGELLEVPVGTSVLRLVRLRTADGAPMGIERSLVSLERFPGLEQIDFAQASLYDTLRDGWGMRTRSVSATARAVSPDADEARHLQIPRTQACMSIRSVQRDGDGGVIEAARSIYRGDRYDLDASYTLPR